MTTCWQEGAPVILTRHPQSPSRKLRYTLQAVEMPDGWVGVNTLNPNRAVAAAIVAGKVKALEGYAFLYTEVKTSTGSRFDICLSARSVDCAQESIVLNPGRAQPIVDFASENCQTMTTAVIEIKNATMRSGIDGVIFPDAVTARGQKHLRHLVEMRKKGFRSILVFFAGRSNTRWVGLAEKIDPEYARTLIWAVANGVEIIGILVEVAPNGLHILGTLPVVTD
jgi:sugar fermentation stimulation protein A